MSEQLLRALGITAEYGEEIRRIGDWLETELKKRGFAEAETNSALGQFAAQAGIARLMAFEGDTPEIVAKRILKLMIQKRKERQGKN